MSTVDGCSAENKMEALIEHGYNGVHLLLSFKGLTLVLQSLTVQSKEEEMKRWEKSTGPPALWQLSPVTGP